MKEEWRDVVGYEGCYAVSNTGVVKSLDRLCIKNNGVKYRLKGKTIKQRVSRGGYVSVALVRNGEYKTFSVHRVVASSFLNNKSNKPQVNHIDGNKENNVAKNLEWVTCSENIIHAIKTGLLPIKRGVNRSNSKLDDMKVLTIKTMFPHNKWTEVMIANHFDIGRGTVNGIRRNYRWRHLGV